jgi:hypothetical protein
MSTQRFQITLRYQGKTYSYIETFKPCHDWSAQRMAEYQYNEGNYACDCNRSLRIGQHCDNGFKEMPCGQSIELVSLVPVQKWQSACRTTVYIDTPYELAVPRRRTVKRYVRDIQAHTIYKGIQVGVIALNRQRITVYRRTDSDDAWTSLFNEAAGLCPETYEDCNSQSSNESNASVSER